MMRYTIKEVSEMMNIPAHTIRYYESEGLLPFIQRDDNGYRVFREEDLGWLDFITCLKVTGMSVNDLRKIITLTVSGEDNFDLRRSILIEHRKTLEEQQQQLDKAFEKVKIKLNYFDKLEQEFKKQNI
ncbi:MerR family transcriptional regulator [Terribacillus saccharophilus]|uniref:DNA-binding transcriptional regulator, MerR family n=1 Tax=Terribacillus saccharophilus TaxID=361277 RepID=A0AAX2ED49_9BACI|nr:MerR family transcriptional regulator [Terribacillus goriensis]SEM79965.1 DNA-binding transcriptional regulator, MerR family [Terribacillus saccharophilus]